MKKEYWFCIIGPSDRNKHPIGFDLPPRRAAIEAIEKAGIKVENCWSGWGVTEEKKERMLDTLHKCGSSNLYIKPTPKLPKKLNEEKVYTLTDTLIETRETINKLIDYLHAEEERKSKIIEDLEEEIDGLERRE